MLYVWSNRGRFQPSIEEEQLVLTCSAYMVCMASSQKAKAELVELNKSLQLNLLRHLIAHNSVFNNFDGKFWRIFTLSKYATEILTESKNFWRRCREHRSRKLFWRVLNIFDSVRQKVWSILTDFEPFCQARQKSEKVNFFFIVPVKNPPHICQKIEQAPQ